MEKREKETGNTQERITVKTIKEHLKNLSNFDKQKIYSGFNYVKDWFKNPKIMADKGTPGRPMKFPYTFSAKFAQFPLKHYFQNQWIWRYYFISVALCLPIFYSISNLANSPGNVAKWAEMKRKEAAEHHH